MGRGAWWATIHRVAKSQTRLRDTRFPLRWELRDSATGPPGKSPRYLLIQQVNVRQLDSIIDSTDVSQ